MLTVTAKLTEKTNTIPDRDFKSESFGVFLLTYLSSSQRVFLILFRFLELEHHFYFYSTFFFYYGIISFISLNSCQRLTLLVSDWYHPFLTLCSHVTPYKETFNWVYLNRTARDRAQWRPCRVQLSSDKIRAKVRKSLRWDFSLFFLLPDGWVVWHSPALALLVAKLLCLCVALPLASLLRIRLHVGMRCRVSSAVPLSPELWIHYLMNLGALNILCVIA